MSIEAIRRFKTDKGVNLTVRGCNGIETIWLSFDDAQELVHDLTEMLEGNLIQVDHVPGNGTIRKHDRSTPLGEALGLWEGSILNTVSQHPRTIKDTVDLFLPSIQSEVRATIRKMVDEGRLKLVKYKLKVVDR